MKKNRTCVDSTLEELSKLQNDQHLTSPMKDQIQTLEMELGFLKMFIWWLSKSNGALFSKHEGSESLRKSHIKYTIGKARKGLYQSGVNALEKGEFTEWDDLVSKLQDKIQQCYPKMEEFYRDLVMDDVDKFKLSTSEIQQSLEFNFSLLDHFCRNYSDNLLLILDYMKRNANVSMKLLKLTGKVCRYYRSTELRNLIKRWVFSLEHTHIFALKLGVKAQTEEDKASQLEKFLFSILKVGIKEQTEEDKDYVSYNIEAMVFVNCYIAILTASKRKSSPSDVLLMGEILFDLVDLVLESPVFHLKEDIVDNIRVALIILISFAGDSPGTDDWNLIPSVYDVLFRMESYMNQQIVEDVTEESDSLILLPDLLDEIITGKAKVTDFDTLDISTFHFPRTDVLLPDLLDYIITVKAKVTDFYTLYISTFHFPRTDVPGLIDNLLVDLKEILECSRSSSTSFLKHQVYTLQKEFLSLRPLLKHVLQLQNEHQGLDDLWIRIANVSHHARDAVNSLFYRSDSICQDIICLLDVMEKIKQIKCDIEKIQQDHQMYDTRVINTELSSRSSLPVHVDTSRIKDFVVRLKDEEENIISRLLRGTSKLHIIAICGMGGLGKTTLARKVHNHPSVQSHFHKHAWCTVSQTYRKEKILLDILNQIIASNDEVSKLKETDLDEKLYKSLKGRKYLIILDDIWDITAWDAIKDSFPNDDNGSRVIFTTRIHHLALQANSDSIVHHLRPLRKEESWQLLQMKLFQKYDCPQEFLDVAKHIANDCKGLPISIVLIAGLISRDVHNLNWWKQIAQSLDSQIASEGGRNILELSYKHLPEFLKPCFLYFGMFQEDKVIRVQKLIQLWISEGFVQDHEKKLSEDVAREYLMDLVARSLVTITKRSSNGGIKACGIHDLLRDFCLAKADEEFFLRVVRGNVVSHSYWHALCKHYRLCIQTKDWRTFFHSYPSHPGVHSLVFSPNTFGSFEWDQYFSFTDYKFLQLLDLEDVKILGDFPEEIAVLVLLRYLAIRCINTSIPPSVANLGNLKFFRVRGTQYGFRLPETIWEMKRLRHVDVGTCIASLEMFSKLDNVQSFSIPCISCGEDVQNLLRRIPRVRKLKCELRQSRDLDMEGNQFPSLNFESKLESLNVIYIGRYLHGCSFSFPSTLRNLTLSSFRLPWKEIAVIGKLPNLEVLKLLENAFKGERWMVDDNEFTNLKFLKLYKLNLREWKVSLDALPCLQQLVVEQCKDLEEIPASLGGIPTLMMIRVHWSSIGAESSAKWILEEQLELGNEDFEVHIIESQSETIFPDPEFWDL